MLRDRRRRAYAPTSNTASHDNHEKINSWVSFDFHIWDAYGAPLGGPSGGAPYSYGKQKETHELIFSWLSWLAVLIMGTYARRRRRRIRATWRP